MSTQPSSFAVVGAVVLLLAGCGKEPAPAPLPAPPGATVEQLRAVSEAADRVAKGQARLEARVAAQEEALVSLRASLEGSRKVVAVRSDASKDQASLEARVKAQEEAIAALREELGSPRKVVENRTAETKVPGDAKEGEPKPLVEEPLPPAPEPPATPPKEAGTPLKGTVLAADTAMDIYLISIGKKDGVKIADEFTVYRGDAFVALVVVDKVFETKASVAVKKVNGKAMKKSDIKTGDKVAGSVL